MTLTGAGDDDVFWKVPNSVSHRHRLHPARIPPCALIPSSQDLLKDSLTLMQPDHPHLRRDFVGYGSDLPHARWPGDARIALNLCVNYEEGGELSVPDGDEASESALTEAGAAASPAATAAESMFEYGSRVGFWRVARLLQARGMPATIFGCGLALERNPQVCAAIRDAGWDVCAHGWRWGATRR